MTCATPSVCCLTRASSTPRNAGSNPLSYFVKPPVIGATFPNVVDLSTTGHGLALVFAFDSPFTFAFPGGQVLLCFDLGGSGELLQQTAQPGPLATFNIQVPLDVSLCGLTLSSQALHFGTVIPFALSNAQDLVVGL